MIGSAIMDTTEKYRYRLTRVWDQDNPLSTLWIMLNPSTADAEKDDPTIRKCIGFSKRWGSGRLTVVNLFAYRATNPGELKKVPDPIGPDNNRIIREEVDEHYFDRIVIAWGNNGALCGRSTAVMNMLKNDPLHCFGFSQTGEPLHPLYIKYGKLLIHLT